MRKMSLWIACVASLTLISLPAKSDPTITAPEPIQSPSTNAPTSSSSDSALPQTATTPTTPPVSADPSTTTTTDTTPSPAPTTPVSNETPAGFAPPSITPPAQQTEASLKPICSAPPTIDASSVQTWAQEAAVQLFSVEKGKLDEQLKNLEDHCFTPTGYASFVEALKVSKNFDAIHSLQLTVSSSVDKTNIQDNQLKTLSKNAWKVTVPLTVVYQNDKNKLTQSMSVDMTVTSGYDKLAIEQVMASIKPTTLPASKPMTP